MNPMLAFMGMGGTEMVVVLCAVLILFGAKKIPEFAKGLGQGIKEFKKATREVSDELNTAMNENPAPPQKSIPAATVPTDPAPATTTSQPGQKA